MKKLKSSWLVILAYASLAISILSIFTTIIGYTNAAGERRTFSLIDFLASGGHDFDAFVTREYTGKILFEVDISIVRIFVVVGIIAIILAILGLALISKQKENIFSFIFTIFGLLGTVAPSLFILFFIVLLGNKYAGTIHCGIYPIVSPIAMAICVFATTQMFIKNIAYKQKVKAAKGLIFNAGDL